jgi:pSer/pThr/pTyr-binding forkhead associated (FHA) protein
VPALSLTLLRGRFAGHSVPLGGQPIVLGREGATVFLDTPNASQKHAELRAEPHGVVLRDLTMGASPIPVLVNRVRTTMHVVSPGDVIEIGADAFRVDLAAPPPRALLIPTKGPLVGRAFPVSTTPVVMGRDADCTIVIASLRASRKHCEVRPEPTGLFLRDLSSGNGTLVNGERVMQRELCPGDLIDVGDEQLRIDPPMASLPSQPIAAGSPGAGGIEALPHGGTSTAQGRSSPSHGGTSTAQGRSSPSQGGTPTAQERSSPSQGGTSTAQERSSPSQGGTSTAQERSSSPYGAPPNAPPPQQLAPALAATVPAGTVPPGGKGPNRARSPLATSHPGGFDATTVRCPRCGRAVDPRLQDCPWDGAALVNGKTFF